MLKKIIAVIALLFTQTVFCQQAKLYNPSIDVLHYGFNLQVTDDNDSLSGQVVITVGFTEKTNSVRFDLVNRSQLISEL
ncbi:MAG: hypothetical protein ABI581_02510 [Sediminibacterium sp.]